MMQTRTTRRQFIQRTALTAGAAAGVLHFGAPWLLADADKEKKLRVAVVGAGGMGGYGLGCGLGENLVALVRR